MTNPFARLAINISAAASESARRANDIVQRIRGMAAKHQQEQVALDLSRR